MTIINIVFTILAAIFIGTLFFYVFKFAGPWGTLWSFLLILIAAGLAAAAWVEPVGPVYYDVAWFPIIFVIVAFALLLAAVTPPNSRRGLEYAEEGSETLKEETPYVALSGFFWIFLTLLIFAAIWGILRY